ncbi:MAG: lytic transglycosylase domain-containing protein [Candidatus Hinthialibacter antarcticus]|nr:lytic transglycosylase domain-containing protein [Candidatus Hinthialibacter antarcticus]
MNTENAPVSAAPPPKRKEAWLVRLPAHLVLLVFLTTVAYAGGSMYWIVRKDNEIEKFRRLEIDLQNQIKERDLRLQQSNQKIEQLGRRVEILDAIKQLSSADVSEVEQRKIALLVDEQSEQYGHDPFFLLALMAAESSLRPWARSNAGARGLMQLMPSTGRALAQQVADDPTLIGLDENEEITSLNFREIEGNIKLGTLYLTQLMVKYQDLEQAVYAYNLGPSIYDKRIKTGGTMPRRYYRKIMKTYQRLQDVRERKESAPIPMVFAQMPPEDIVAQASKKLTYAN